MKSKTQILTPISNKQTKQKKTELLGKSQFIRQRLDKGDQYIPKLKKFRPSKFMHKKIEQQQLHDNNLKYKRRVRTQVSSQQKEQIANKAMNCLKLGKSIDIDWNTKSNFRTTFTKSHILTRQRQVIRQLSNTQNVQKKQQQQLAKRRNYLGSMIKRKKQQHQMKLQMLRLRKANQLRKKIDLQIKINASTQVKPNKKLSQFVSKMQKFALSPKNTLRDSKLSSKSYDMILSSLQGDSRTKIFLVQQEILKKSKLLTFKKELEQKFFQIREAYNLQKNSDEDYTQN